MDRRFNSGANMAGESGAHTTAHTSYKRSGPRRNRLSEQRIRSVRGRSGPTLKLPDRNPITRSANRRLYRCLPNFQCGSKSLHTNEARAKRSDGRRDFHRGNGALIIAILQNAAAVGCRLFRAAFGASRIRTQSVQTCGFQRATHRGRTPNKGQAERDESIYSPRHAGLRAFTSLPNPRFVNLTA